MVNAAPTPAEVMFLGHHAGERVQFFFRQHWIRLLWPIARTLLGTALILTAGYLIFLRWPIDASGTRRPLLVFLLGSFLLIHLVFLARFYRHFLYIVVVTDRRIHRIKKTLVTYNEHQTIDLWMLQEIHKLQRGPVQNIFQFGTLTCEAQETILKVHFVPKIAEKYTYITALREQARMQSSYAGVTPRQREAPGNVEEKIEPKRE